MEILIIKQTSLGDVLHSTVAVNILKNHFPNSRITFMVDKSAFDLIKYNKDIDKIIIFDFNLLKNKWLKKPLKVFNHIKDKVKEIRNIHYDLAFDLQGLSRSVFFLYLAKADIKFVKGKWLFLNKYRKNNIHAVDEIKNLIYKGISQYNNHKDISSLMNKYKNYSINIYTKEKEKIYIENLLKELNPTRKKILVVSPFTRWQSKDWGEYNYINLLKLIDEENIQIILTGSHDRKTSINHIKQSSGKNNVINLVDKLTFLEYIELIRQSDLVLSSDGFPVHLACAVDTPVIAIFGPTDEAKVGPISHNSIVMRGDVPCKKCGRRICKDKRCMVSLSPEKVYMEIEKILIKVQPTKKP